MMKVAPIKIIVIFMAMGFETLVLGKIGHILNLYYYTSLAF